MVFQKGNKINVGKHLSEETKRKIGLGNKNKIVSEETRRKISEIHKDKPLSAEHKRALSEAHTGLILGPHSDEWNKNIGEGNKGKKHTEESKQRNSELKKGNTYRLGSKASEETIQKLRESHKGQVPCNKGLKGQQVSWCKGLHLSDEHKKKISESNKGKKQSEEWIKNFILARTGKKRKPFSEEWLKNMSEGRKGKYTGEKNWNYGRRGCLASNWKGDKAIEPENMRIRKSHDYFDWRTSVFIRDDYTCQICGVKGGKLNAHHIKSFSKHPELRFEVSNGITHCKPCHKEVHKNKLQLVS